MLLDIDYDLDNAIGYQIGLVATQLKIALRRAFVASGLDITPEQWVVLYHLERGQGPTQSELGDRTVKDKPTVTRILDRLEAKGLAARHRDPRDRRTQRIFLTPEGEAVLQQLMPLVRHFAGKAFGDVSPEERQGLIATLGRIGSRLDRLLLEPKDKP
jgi:DNA-binding MarR family transcriptional regulator